MGILFVCIECMGKVNFKFQNQDRFQSFQRKSFLSEETIKKLVITSSFSTVFIFLTLNIIHFSDANKRIPDWNIEKSIKQQIKKLSALFGNQKGNRDLNNKTDDPFSGQESSFVKEVLKEAHVFPLLVNLKGEEGPFLAKVHVYITLSEDSPEKKLLSHNNRLEKQLLFILSGQSVKSLSRKKDHFEREIRSQLNSFLTNSFINGVYIQTEMLN